MASKPPLTKQHTEPERPVVYEPPDLHGRKHVEKGITGLTMTFLFLI